MRPILVTANGFGRTISPSVKYQRVCPGAVVIHTAPEKVGKPYREVALLNSKGETSWSIDEPKAGRKIIGAVLGTGSERKGKALAIYVPEDSVHNAEVCAVKV